MTNHRRLPAEWEPQAALWLSWPVSSHIWPGKQDAIAEKFAGIVAAASRFQRVNINADAEAHVAIRAQLRHANAVWENTWLYEHPTNDVWCRDHGPIFVQDAGGAVVATNWKFNAWGGKFEPWDLDDAVPALMAQSLEIPCENHRLILEGGAIDSNGGGVLLTTEPVLLNPNRNAGATKATYEARFADAFGAEEVIWLPEGLPNDDTDGHIDNLARFVAENAVLCVVDERLPALGRNRDLLQERFGTVAELPLPDPIRPAKDQELPASYANFVVINGAVLAPVFAQDANDQRALAILREHFPDREIVPVDCRLLLEEGGALHCISANQWA